MDQLSLFDGPPAISRVHCDTMDYEVGVKGVGSIELTNHGSAKTVIYKVCDTAGDLMVYAGFLPDHEVEFGGWSL